MVPLIKVVLTVFLLSFTVLAQPHHEYKTMAAAPRSNRLRACQRVRRQGTLQPGEACSTAGLKCAWSKSTCPRQWDSTTNACKDLVFTNTCQCEDGQWICEMASCARPDARCD